MVILPSLALLAVTFVSVENCNLRQSDVSGLVRSWNASHNEANPFKVDVETVVEMSEIGNLQFLRVSGDNLLFMLDNKRAFRRWSATSLKYRSVREALKPFFWLYQRSTSTELWLRYGRLPFDPSDLGAFSSEPELSWRSCRVVRRANIALSLDPSQLELMHRLIKTQIVDYLYDNGYEGFTNLRLKLRKPLLADSESVDVDVEFTRFNASLSRRLSVLVNPSRAPFVGPVESTEPPESPHSVGQK